MGIIDQVIGSLMGGTDGESPLQGVLSSLLGGNNDEEQHDNSDTTTGGLSSLLSGFQQAGLGHIAESWIGNGANQSVSPQQLQNVFGDQHVAGMADQAGMGSQDFLAQLSEHLPNAVHNMTPHGRLPHSDDAEGSLSV